MDGGRRGSQRGVTWVCGRRDFREVWHGHVGGGVLPKGVTWAVEGEDLRERGVTWVSKATSLVQLKWLLVPFRRKA